MYVDLTVEGTPEEVAAFKHIDAALAARSKPKAITAKPARRPAFRRADTLAQRRAIRDWANRNGHAVAPKGVIAAKIVAAYQEAHP
jgi:hypothetical protein